MEVDGGRHAPAHRDRGRQARGGAQHPATRLAARIAVEMHHLAFAMHAGIGAACAHHLHWGIGHRGQRRLQAGLYARPAMFAQLLPALKLAAVVLHAQRVTHRNLPVIESMERVD